MCARACLSGVHARSRRCSNSMRWESSAYGIRVATGGPEISGWSALIRLVIDCCPNLCTHAPCARPHVHPIWRAHCSGVHAATLHRRQVHSDWNALHPALSHSRSVISPPFPSPRPSPSPLGRSARLCEYVHSAAGPVDKAPIESQHIQRALWRTTRPRRSALYALDRSSKPNGSARLAPHTARAAMCFCA